MTTKTEIKRLEEIFDPEVRKDLVPVGRPTIIKIPFDEHKKGGDIEADYILSQITKEKVIAYCMDLGVEFDYENNLVRFAVQYYKKQGEE